MNGNEISKEQRAHDLAVAFSQALHPISGVSDMHTMLQNFGADYEMAYKYFREHLSDNL